MSKWGKCHPTLTGETNSWLSATPVDPDTSRRGNSMRALANGTAVATAKWPPRTWQLETH